MGASSEENLSWPQSREPEDSCSPFFSTSGSSTGEEFSKADRFIEFDFRPSIGKVQPKSSRLAPTGDSLDLS
jgi:hypothetical protein